MTTDLSQFLQTFYEESAEGLTVMESGLLHLDVGAADAEEINSIFRAAHSIKGGSGTFGLTEVASFTHLLETLLDQWRERSRPVTQEGVDVLLAAVDCLREMLANSRAGMPLTAARIDSVRADLQRLLDPSSSAPASAPKAARQEPQGAGWKIEFKPHRNLFRSGNDPVRIFRELADLGELEAVADLSALPPFGQFDPEESYLAWSLTLRGDMPRAAVDEAFAWVEGECDLQIDPLVSESAGTAPGTLVSEEPSVSGELLVERRKSADRRSGDRRASAQLDSSSIRVSIEKVDAVINLVGELVITQSMLSTLGASFDMTQLQKLRDGLAQLERNTRELQEDVMRMRMMPIGFAFNRFPRLVHDLGIQLGKSVELEISGETTELDKTLIEKLSDPLVHLVRNALDHGIEPAADRLAAGKAAAGKIALNAYHKSGNIVIEVRDDGRGLNVEKILEKARERGLVGGDALLSDEEIHDLIFLPGFSTAEVVSDVSGRGVGMDVVRRNIQSLGGSVEIASTPGEGSCFTVRLPLTLAILDGQTVAVDGENYIVPLVSIIESVQVKPAMVNRVAGQAETFHWRGKYLPVIRLSAVFNVCATRKSLTEGLIVVVEGEGRQLGLFVDELLGQQQVVIKSLESNYKRVEGISGATILGDGSVALILDIPSLIRLSNGSGAQTNAKRA